MVIRFSGTEPLLRIFSEMPSRSEAGDLCDCDKRFLEV